MTDFSENGIKLPKFHVTYIKYEVTQTVITGCYNNDGIVSHFH